MSYPAQPNTSGTNTTNWGYPDWTYTPYPTYYQCQCNCNGNKELLETIKKLIELIEKLVEK